VSEGQGEAFATLSAIPFASAATTKSSLDLLGLAFPFSQVGLLSASDFVTQAAKRRSLAVRHFPMSERILEELHRHGILVPLFRVDLAPTDRKSVLDVSASLTARHVATTLVSELYRGIAEGRVADPAVEVFHPWPHERRRSLWPSVDAAYLYSRHQLLGLDVARNLISALKLKQADNKTTWYLDEVDQPNEPTLAALRSWRSVAITLMALDTYYWPFITRTVNHDKVWRAALQAFSPSDMLSWLGLSLDQIVTQASDLRIMATFRDDLGDFYDLIRRAKAKAWETLRGDAMAAMDCRLAADILDRYAEEVSGLSEDLVRPSAPLPQQGLSSRPHSLDAALTELWLSPFPSLVIGVEGETEYRLVPRVMGLLGIELDRNWIQIVDFGGTKKDLSLLARYAAEPVLGNDLGDYVVLDRPYTRFLVLVDAENKYKTPADRQKQRKLLLKSLTQNIPAGIRGDLGGYRLKTRAVEIRTWGRLPFEFAHFTDGQLADAMLKVARRPHPGGRATLAGLINAERLGSYPNVERIGWPGRGAISKPDLADATWPLLETRIRSAITKGHRGPPIMKAVLRAYEMASPSFRSSVVLRRR
jgi:hypothetical protein